MKDRSAESILEYMIELILYYLDDLSEVAENDPDFQFFFGEKTAYVECLEIIQLWEKSHEHKLNFDIESIYPLILQHSQHRLP